jgi:hypothetical protein
MKSRATKTGLQSASYTHRHMNQQTHVQALHGTNMDPKRACACSSRHRFQHTPPSTPPGFWKVGFSTQDEEEAKAKHTCAGDGGLAAGTREILKRRSNSTIMLGGLI